MAPSSPHAFSPSSLSLSLSLSLSPPRPPLRTSTPEKTNKNGEKNTKKKKLRRRHPAAPRVPQRPGLRLLPRPQSSGHRRGRHGHPGIDQGATAAGLSRARRRRDVHDGRLRRPRKLRQADARLPCGGADVQRPPTGIQGGDRRHHQEDGQRDGRLHREAGRADRRGLRPLLPLRGRARGRGSDRRE